MASAVNFELLSLASDDQVYQCVDSLSVRRSTLARMLVDASQQCALSQLLYAMTSSELLNTDVVPGIMALDNTDEERCSKFFSCIEGQILGISGMEARKAYIVKLLTTLMDNDLREVALNIHWSLSIAIIQEMEGNYSPVPYSTDCNTVGMSEECTRESHSSDAGQLRSTMSCPGAASAEPEPLPDLQPSVSEESGLSSPQQPLAIKVLYSDQVYGPEEDDGSDDEIYMNCSYPRGLVFIANYTFSKSESRHLKPREGSDRDAANLKELFEQMGYCVPEVHTDLDKMDSLIALRKFRDNPRHAELHSSVLVIMSHGKDEGSFYTDDGRFIKTTEVLDLFNNQNCEALASKFKLFIFQFCRGVLLDRGTAKNVSLKFDRRVLQTDSAAWGHTRYDDDLPTHSDQFCIHPCVEGYVSLRHPDRGTWLIEALCDVFMNHARDKDLNKLVQMVSKKIRANKSENGMKQTCEVRARGVVKNFYFNPTKLDNFNRFPNLSELSTALSAPPEWSQPAAPHSPSSHMLLSPPPLTASPRPEAAKRAYGDHLSPSWPKRRRDAPRTRNNSGSPHRGQLPVTFANDLFPSDKRHSADLQFLQPSSLGIEEPAQFGGDPFIVNVTSDLGPPPVLDMEHGDTVDSPSRSESSARDSGAIPRRHFPSPQRLFPHSNSMPSYSSADHFLTSEDSRATHCPPFPHTPPYAHQAWSESLFNERKETEDSDTLGAAGFGHSSSLGSATSAASLSLRLPRRHTVSNVDPASGNNELTYREYRRQKSMETGRTLDDAPGSIKRQLSIESERELLGHMNKVKSYFTIHQGEDSPEIRSVDQVMRFLQSKTAMTKKARFGLPHSQE